MVPLRGFGGGGAGCRRNRKGSSNVAQQNPHKDQVCARQEPREQTCKAWEHSLGFDPQRDQAGGRPRPAETAYAFFPKARRLLIEKQGNLTTYDSGEHQISGMQQSGETSSLTFTSQNGAVRLDDLKKVG